MQASIVGPYTADVNTLHLWHMDASVVPVPDAVATGGTNLVKLVNGATLGNSAYPGFGTALSTLDGGQDGIAQKDAYLTASSAGTAGNVVITVADTTTGAFTFEALVWIGFDPAKNFGATGNNRATTCQIVNGDGAANANRIFQWRISPIGTVSGNITVNLDFANIHNTTPNQLMSIPIPATGADAIASNNWHHVAVAYNGFENTASNITFYWTLLDPSRTNANAIGSFTMTNDLVAAANVFTIGNSPGRTPANANFLGLIDEVRISSIARTSDSMMFTLSPPIVTSPLTGQTVGVGQSAGLSVTASPSFATGGG